MPRLKITTAEDKEIVVSNEAILRAEIDRFEEAIQALIPAIEGTDDDAAARAIARYSILSYNLTAILNELPWWNETAEEEHRAARRRLAAELRARKSGG
jgi:hypothetical protein